MKPYYSGPLHLTIVTEHTPGGIRARSGWGEYTTPYDTALQPMDAHYNAAITLARQLNGWVEENEMIGGHTPDGYAWMVKSKE